MRPTDWIASSLHRKFTAAAVAGLLAVSLLFLVVFVSLYRSQINDERARLAGEVNQLLQAALENAMLKRDLDGLRQIVDRLGQQEAIRLVMILNPEGVVRFSSDPSASASRSPTATIRLAPPACNRPI